MVLVYAITQANDWTREAFALAIAVQNISWGIAGIFAGMAAETAPPAHERRP